MSVRQAFQAFALAALSITLLPAVDFSNYRGFRFGSNLSEAAKHAGTRASEVKTLHERPALLQELEWRYRSKEAVDSISTDPVLGGELSFLDGKLYRIVVIYDSYRIEGMTANDLVDAISQSFGTASRPDTEVSLPSIYSDSVKVIARWQDAEYAYDLVRTGNQRDYALVLYSKRMDALAQAAKLDAVRMDLKEAPQRALADEKQRSEDLRVAGEKARAKNKPHFRP